MKNDDDNAIIMSSSEPIKLKCTLASYLTISLSVMLNTLLIKRSLFKHINSINFLFQDYWSPSLLGEVYVFALLVRGELVTDLKFVNIVATHLVILVNLLLM